MTTDLTIPVASPFDAIRRTDEGGIEYWSARDLMPLLDYDRWERFEDAVARAEAAINNSDEEAPDHIRGAAKMVTLGSGAKRNIVDFHLTRYGAYMVAMNSDPRKPAVAQAQTYFAIRTREAETSPVQRQIPRDLGEALRLAADEYDARRLAESKVRELEGPAAQAETFRAAEGLCTIGDLANRFQAWARTERPEAKVAQQQVFDHAGRVGLIIRGNTVRHNQPTSQAIKAGWVKPHRVAFDTNTRGMQTKVSTRLTPAGEARLWDHLVRYITDHGSLDIKDAA